MEVLGMVKVGSNVISRNDPCARWLITEIEISTTLVQKCCHFAGPELSLNMPPSENAVYSVITVSSLNETWLFRHFTEKLLL